MKTTCPVCGKQIKQEKHVEGGRPKRFCSPRCSEIAYYARNRETLRSKERAYRAIHPRPSRAQGRNVAANKVRDAAPNLTFVPKREPVERDSVARVTAYLSLPAAERRARLDTLTKAEQATARNMWLRMKCETPLYSRAF